MFPYQYILRIVSHSFIAYTNFHLSMMQAITLRIVKATIKSRSEIVNCIPETEWKHTLFSYICMWIYDKNIQHKITLITMHLQSTNKAEMVVAEPQTNIPQSEIEIHK